MKTWFRSLDEILRGDATSIDALRSGRLDIPVGELTPLLLQLGAFYGFCMGWFSILNHDDPQYIQILASMLKVPALFFFTLVVTLPSLYVFNALVGSRLNFQSILSLLVGALGVTIAVLASFGPIVAFFSVTSTSYSFILLFNVAVFGVAGLLGLGFMLRTLQRLTAAMITQNDASGAGAESWLVEAPSQDDDDDAAEPVEPGTARRRVRTVFAVWMVVFALVGTQMSWVLRPFIGTPGKEFTWFRVRESSFIEAVIAALSNL
jgi:hypothetical protein